MNEFKQTETLLQSHPWLNKLLKVSKSSSNLFMMVNIWGGGALVPPTERRLKLMVANIIVRIKVGIIFVCNHSLNNPHERRDLILFIWTSSSLSWRLIKIVFTISKGKTPQVFSLDTQNNLLQYTQGGTGGCHPLGGPNLILITLSYDHIDHIDWPHSSGFLLCFNNTHEGAGRHLVRLILH